MLTILHGEHTNQSREKLAELIQTAKEKGQEIERLAAKGLTAAKLEESLGSQNLFHSDRLVIIEELHSLPRSNKKTELLDLIETHTAQNADIVLWERRSLTKTMLKKFTSAQATEYKMSKALFKWLDTLGSSGKSKAQKLQLLERALDQDGAHFCFVMLIRQIRLLLISADGGTIAGAPFVQKKISSQARQFSIQQLLTLHSRLLKIDLAQKTSSNTLTLQQELDLVTISL